MNQPSKESEEKAKDLAEILENMYGGLRGKPETQENEVWDLAISECIKTIIEPIALALDEWCKRGSK